MADSKIPGSGFQPQSKPGASRLTVPNTVLGLLFNTVKLLVQACAFFLVSKSIHSLVHSLDAVYDTVGRRSRTKFERVEWGRLVLGVTLLVGWHVLLVKLSILSSDFSVGKEVLDEEERVGKSTKLSWGRLLGRVVIPAVLILAGAGFAVRLACRLFFFHEFI